jgi:hypothetical protein
MNPAFFSWKINNNQEAYNIYLFLWLLAKKTVVIITNRGKKKKSIAKNCGKNEGESYSMKQKIW